MLKIQLRNAYSLCGRECEALNKEFLKSIFLNCENDVLLSKIFYYLFFILFAYLNNLFIEKWFKVF